MQGGFQKCTPQQDHEDIEAKKVKAGWFFSKYFIYQEQLLNSEYANPVPDYARLSFVRL